MDLSLYYSFQITHSHHQITAFGCLASTLSTPFFPFCCSALPLLIGAMAEYFVGPVMEKLIDACFEYLKDQVRWQTGMKEELQSLRKIHPQIQAVVSAYSQAQIKDPNLRKWLWQLRDAVDEADDVLDDFEYRKREKEASKNKNIRRKTELLDRALEIGKRAFKIDPDLKRLEEAVQNLYKVSSEVSTFLRLLDGTKQAEQQQQHELHRKREAGSMPTNDLLGRSKEMEFVRRWLRNPYQTEITNSTDLYRNVSLLSVVGHGGMGKTTLLQHVYKDGVTKEFDVKMWACVSTNFDTKTVIKNILESLKAEKPHLNSLEALQSSLQSELMSTQPEVMPKRFLLVLDDIWEADETKWRNVLAPLSYGRSGSKILITTRMDSVALMFAKMIRNGNKKLSLKGLEEDEFLQLFNTHAFAGVENHDDKLKFIAEKMVEKLSRCPLAAKVIGGILNFCMDEEYWEKVLNTNIGNIEPDQNELLPILKLSYIYLPKFLQNCFAFCCMFPQDHEFDKDDLVRMWIALGFIQPSNIRGETVEHIGGRYFDVLVRKSFFEEFRTYDRKVCYKMHDLLHELAQFVSAQECFIIKHQMSPNPPETIRHLSIHDGRSTLRSSSQLAALQKTGKFKNLRSLFLCGDTLDEDIICEILKASRSIRLLAMEYYPHSQKIYKMLSCLIHLRYLKVGKVHGFNLPISISHLYQLQFIISHRLSNLEKADFGWKELMPNENCQLILNQHAIKDPSVLLMEQLRIISSLTIEQNDELASFSRETERWFLQHSSSLLELKFQKLKSLQSLPSALESLSLLQTLRVYDVPQLKLLPNPPSASLTRLELYNLESLQCLPSSLSAISCLNYLELRNIPLLQSLPDLPSSLLSLTLKELEKLDCLPSSLPTLHNLQVLDIKRVPRLLQLPGLPASLEVLSIEDCHLRLMDRYKGFIKLRAEKR